MSKQNGSSLDTIIYALVFLYTRFKFFEHTVICTNWVHNFQVVPPIVNKAEKKNIITM